MKSKLYLLMLTLFAFCAVSCSDDEPEVKPAEEVAGVYNGYTVANCKYFSDMTAEDQVLTLTATGDATVNATYTSDSWGEFSVKNATVVQSGNTYKIQGTGVTVMGMNGATSEYECSFEGTVQASETSATPTSFVFSVAGVMGGLTIDFIESDMPSAE